jgi:hypothetical protein
MKQEGLKQEVVTLHAPFIIPGVNIGGVNMFTNTLQLNANGFNWYNATGTAIGDKLPQSELWT